MIRKLARAHVHRLFVVDDDGRSIGVISLRDVIAKFVKEPANSGLSQYFVATVRM